MAAASTQAVKAGWMQRQTEIFKRWKRQYCVLYMDGGFSYFSDETRRSSDGSLHLTTNVNFIKVGVEVLSVPAPSDRTMGCLLELQTTKGNLYFCADTPDDAEAWKITMVEVKNMNVRGKASAPPPPGPPPAYATTGAPPHAPPVQNSNPPPYPQTYPAPYPQTYPAPYPQTYPAPYQQTNPPPYQQSVPPANQIVVVPTPNYPPQQQVMRTTVYRNGRSRYPTQTTVYTYPGQTHYGVGGNTPVCVTSNGQTTVYQQNGVQPGQTIVLQQSRNNGTVVMTPGGFW